MKSVWKGSIAFGLVNIPIQLFTAHESEALGFNLLHEKCKTPLKYRRWCPKCKKEVTWDQTVKGIKKSDGSYLVLTKEMIKKLRPEKTEEIRIVEFVAMDQIPIIYLNHHYYVAPLKKNDNAYTLFIKALEKLDKAAIGRFVMRDKEYTCAIQPNEGYLLLTTLYYAYEVRDLEHLMVKPKAKLNATELKLAQDFIKKLSVKKFDITDFKDTFAQEIKKLLKQKAKKGRKTKVKVVTPRKKKSTLVESLRTSLENIKPAAYAKGRRKR